MHRSRFSTTTYPDGSTRIEEYYQDGTLYSVTGSAVHPVRYEYLLASGTASTERIGIKEIKLGENGDSEFILTWKDMAGCYGFFSDRTNARIPVVAVLAV